EGTKRYDGSGRPRLHVLFFADDDAMANVGLGHHLFATKPDGFSDDLKGYVDGSQLNKHGDAESKWPICHGPSGVHGDDGVLQLKHTEEDHDAGLRAYCADVMDGLPCHQDWQTSDGEAMLLQYVSKYVAKFSDSSYDEWMSDKASADSVARRVCFEYHPNEPEMILQLCGAQFRQYDISTVSGGFRTVTAPYSGMADVPDWVQRYVDCSWRHEGMALLEWLRKTTDDGAIAGWLKRKHKQELVLALHRRCRATLPEGEEPRALDAHWRFLRAEYKGMADADGGGSGNSDEASGAEDEEQPKTFEEFLAKKHRDEKSEGEDDFPNLKEFARAFRMQGEKVVSVDTVYELNDRYYGQWAAMNVPFRSLDELEFEDVNRLVPQKYKYLAAALRLCSDQGRVAEGHHDLFTDDRRLVDYMSASAKSSKFTEAVHRMIVGQRKLINMYLTGIIDKADEKAAADVEAAVIGNRRPARDEGQEEVDFNPKQLQLEEAINERVDRAVRAELSEEWEEAGEAREEAYKKNTPVICLGKPGTGKTTVVKFCIRRAQEQGARVLFALPTAQLSSRMRAALQDLEGLTVDTCHAAFKLHDPITESLHRMTDFDLVVVDECESFERILKLWSVAGKVPALVFLGDKHQLPGVEPSRPWESAAWKRPRCFHVKLTETWRCKEERFQEILDELRTDKPSKETFRKIVRDHKAWKSSGDPTPAEMKKLFEKHPDTRIVTCTRRGAAAVNEAAVAALCGRKTPLARLNGDVELNPENYLDGKLRTDRRLVPSRVPIHKGMQLYLTKNNNKEADEVNGMLCAVENYRAEEDMLRVMTKTGHRLAITRWTDREKGNAVYFPIRLGCASTIDKVQGDEFPHIAIYLDGWPRPAAGYTALSRVATSDDYLIGGFVERDNFMPAFWRIGPRRAPRHRLFRSAAMAWGAGKQYSKGGKGGKGGARGRGGWKGGRDAAGWGGGRGKGAASADPCAESVEAAGEAKAYAAKPDLHLAKQALRSAIAPCGPMYLNGAESEMGWLDPAVVAATRDKESSEACARMDMWVSMLCGTVSTGTDVAAKVFDQEDGDQVARARGLLAALGTADGQAFVNACDYLNVKNKPQRSKEETGAHLHNFLKFITAPPPDFQEQAAALYIASANMLLFSAHLVEACALAQYPAKWADAVDRETHPPEVAAWKSEPESGEKLLGALRACFEKRLLSERQWGGQPEPRWDFFADGAQGAGACGGGGGLRLSAYSDDEAPPLSGIVLGRAATAGAASAPPARLSLGRRGAGLVLGRPAKEAAAAAAAPERPRTAAAGGGMRLGTSVAAPAEGVAAAAAMAGAPAKKRVAAKATGAAAKRRNQEEDAAKKRAEEAEAERLRLGNDDPPEEGEGEESEGEESEGEKNDEDEEAEEEEDEDAEEDESDLGARPRAAEVPQEQWEIAAAVWGKEATMEMSKLLTNGQQAVDSKTKRVVTWNTVMKVLDEVPQAVQDLDGFKIARSICENGKDRLRAEQARQVVAALTDSVDKLQAIAAEVAGADHPTPPGEAIRRNAAHSVSGNTQAMWFHTSRSRRQPGGRFSRAIAPYDWSFPYHVALTDSMAKRAPRQWYPVLETIHMTHVMTQAVLGLLCGAHKHRKPAGRENDYQIIPALDDDGNPVDVFPVLRVEFQDGTHKDPTQDYHGSGRPHVHALLFGVDVKKWKLHEWARATLPREDEGIVRGYVLGAQLDKNKQTKWPVHEGPSCWDEDEGTYKLRHSAKDKSQGVRAWIDALLEALNGSHQDLQFSVDESSLSVYVAKYVPKFSDAFANDFLDDENGLGGDGTAAGILSRYRPLEPEMALQLLAQHMPQWKIVAESQGARDFLVPWPEQENMSLLEFLRKSDDGNQGKIVQWLQRKHRAEVVREGYEWYKTHLPTGTAGRGRLDERKPRPPHPNAQSTWCGKMRQQMKDTGEAGQVSLRDYLAHVGQVEFTVPHLETFARDYETKGEKAVCCNMRSRLNDLFYGQWLVLHVPFRKRADLIPALQLGNVPKEHRNLAMAVMSSSPIARTMWHGICDDGIEQEFRLEGHKAAYRETIMNYVRTHRQLIFDYIAGRVPVASASLGQMTDGLIRPARVQVERVVHLPTQQRFAELIPHQKDVEGRVRIGEAAGVRVGDMLQLGTAKARVLSVLRFDDFRTMLQQLGHRRAVPSARTISAVLRICHGFRGYERLAAQHGVVAFELGPPDQAPRDPLDGPVRLQPQQAAAVRLAEECIGRALRCKQAATEAERDAARAEARAGSKILVVDGPPGTGKSFVQHLLVRRTLERGGRVLYTFLTANHAARARQTFGDAVDIDTFHGALGDGSDPCHARGVLELYALVMVDECFLLQEKLFLHLRRLYIAADMVPCVMLAGDKNQMGSPGGRPCFFSPSWGWWTCTTTLRYDSQCAQRTSDTGFIRMLNKLRMKCPAERGGDFSVPILVRGRKAWLGDRPTLADVRNLFHKYPCTTVLAISREAVQDFNQLAVAAFHTDDQYLGTIRGDVESDPANYDENKQLKPHRRLKPMDLHLYKGMTAVITRNVEKPYFVNGTICTVEAYDGNNGGVRLIASEGRRLLTWLKSDPGLGNIAYHALRPGYCATIIKFQGAELRHVTLWLDIAGVPGAAYTGLSRVKSAQDYLIGGFVKRKHITPACEGWRRRWGKRPHGQAFEPRPEAHV
ncbi:unnamed protein product, partial [Prorocentrum cordatum]